MSMRKISKFICLGAVALMALMYGCGENRKGESVSAKESAKQDSVVINIQPLDGVRDVSGPARELKEKYLDKIGIERCKINILPHKNSPDSVYNKQHTRFRAEKLLMFLNSFTPKKEYTIGVTDRDISTSVHGHEDYGIFGLASLRSNKRACITSTHRMKKKKDLWKLMAHEFTHGFYGMKHCKDDVDECIMQDAKGGNPRFDIKTELCPGCTKILKTKQK